MHPPTMLLGSTLLTYLRTYLLTYLLAYLLTYLLLGSTPAARKDNLCRNLEYATRHALKPPAPRHAHAPCQRALSTDRPTDLDDSTGRHNHVSIVV